MFLRPILQPFSMPGLNSRDPQFWGLHAWWPGIGSPGGAKHWPELMHGLAVSFNGSVGWKNSELFGPVMNFPGAGNYITIPATSVLDLGGSSAAVAMWLRTTTGVAHLYQAYDLGGAPFSGFAFAIGLVASGKLSYWSSVHGSWVSANTAVNDGNWHHVGMSVRGGAGGVVEFYVNGKPDGNPASREPGSYTGARGIGAANTGSNPVTGDIFDLRLYRAYKTGGDFYRMYAPATRWDLYRQDSFLIPPPPPPEENFAGSRAGGLAYSPGP